jgi:hypothetical protein
MSLPGRSARRACRARVLSFLVLSTLAAVGTLPPATSRAVNVAQSVVVSPDPVDWTPHALDGQVNAVAKVGTRIVVGGSFTQVQEASGGPTLTRNYLFAYDARTGAVDRAFTPRLDGSVQALAPSPAGGAVFVGGFFDNVNGNPSKSLAKLEIPSGDAVAAFSAHADASVRDLVVWGTRLFVGGTFHHLNGVPRETIGMLDTVTGTVDPDLDLAVAGTLYPGVGVPLVARLDVSPDGSHLVMIGNFRTVNGLERPQAAMIDLTRRPAAVANWRNDRYGAACALSIDTYVRDVDFSPDGSYFVIVTTGAGGYPDTLCDTAARYATNELGDVEPQWVDYTGGDTLTAVAITGAAIYVGGHQRWLNNEPVSNVAAGGAVPRAGIAALDPQNGMPLRWNPTRSRGRGVFALASTARGLLVGSDTDKLGGEYHGRLGFFPVQGGSAVPIGRPERLPGSLYEAPRAAGSEWLVRRSFDGTTVGARNLVATPGVDWSNARGTFALNGWLYAGWSDGRLYAWPFSGSALGPRQDLIAAGRYVIPDWIDLSDVTGMFWLGGRLYYTRAGDRHLFSRAFTPESKLIGSIEEVVSGDGDGLSWRGVHGLTAASGHLFYARSKELHRIDFAAGEPVPGTDTVIGGPAVDGRSYGSNGLFILGS